MAYAIDRNALIKGAMSGYGIPIGSHMDPGNPYYIDLTSTYAYNPEKAKQLLAEAGYPNGFEAVIKLPERFAYAKRTGEIIADMLSQVGIKLKIELTEWGQWIDRVFKNADFDLTVIGHAEPFDINIYANPKYYFRYDNPKFQETLKKAEMEANPKIRERTLYHSPEDHRGGCGERVFICVAQPSHHEKRSDELVEGLSDDGC